MTAATTAPENTSTDKVDCPACMTSLPEAPVLGAR